MVTVFWRWFDRMIDVCLLGAVLIMLAGGYDVAVFYVESFVADVIEAWDDAGQ